MPRWVETECAIPFEYAAYLNDRLLKKVSFNVRGIWMHLLCLMWCQGSTGMLTGTDEDFVRDVECTEIEWLNFKHNLKTHKFGDMEVNGDKITICNRRMLKAYRKRLADSKRKRDERAKLQQEIEIEKLRTPYKAIVELYNDICARAGMNRCLSYSEETRKKNIRARYKEHPDLKWFEMLFQKAASSPFLTGKTSDFKAGLDFVVRPTKVTRIVEGFYDNIRTDNGKGKKRRRPGEESIRYE